MTSEEMELDYQAKKAKTTTKLPPSSSCCLPYEGELTGNKFIKDQTINLLPGLHLVRQPDGKSLYICLTSDGRIIAADDWQSHGDIYGGYID